MRILLNSDKIVFDECHKAKNLCPVGSSKPTKTGQTVLELQNRLPNARIVYASATGASEPKNMAYMTRLGLWGPGTPFPEFNDFIQAVEKRYSITVSVSLCLTLLYKKKIQHCKKALTLMGAVLMTRPF